MGKFGKWRQMSRNVRIVLKFLKATPRLDLQLSTDNFSADEKDCKHFPQTVHINMVYIK